MAKLQDAVFKAQLAIEQPCCICVMLCTHALESFSQPSDMLISNGARTNDIQGLALQDACHINDLVLASSFQETKQLPYHFQHMTEAMPVRQTTIQCPRKSEVSNDRLYYARRLLAPQVVEYKRKSRLMLFGLKAGMTPFLTSFHCCEAVSADSKL